MKENHAHKFLRHATIAVHILLLLIKICAAFPFILIGAIKRTSNPHRHLKGILAQKYEMSSNFYPLTEKLAELKDDTLIVAGTLKKQCAYMSKDELFATLPEKAHQTEIIAIPLAIFAFGIFRHFVTIIVDFRENTIEFYDPLGLSIYQHHSVVLWGRACHKGECIFLPEFIDFIQKKYDIDGITDNSAIHQTDFTQCAIFVYDRIYKRAILELTLDEANNDPLTSIEAF